MSEGFVSVRRGRHLIYLRDDLAAEGAERICEEIVRALTGRSGPKQGWRGRGGRLSVFRARVGGRDVVVRRFTHGGLLGRLLPEATLGKRRILGELATVRHALDSGVNTPKVLAAVFQRRALVFQRAHVITEEAQGACNLTELFLQLPMLDAPLAARRKRAAIEAAARAIARMHEAGILHADLHLRNILVRLPAIEQREHLAETTVPYVLDFDRSRRLGELSVAQRRANLRRLMRSVRKVRPVGDHFALRDAVRFLRAYLGTEERSAVLPWLADLSRPLRWRETWWKVSGTARDAGTDTKAIGVAA